VLRLLLSLLAACALLHGGAPPERIVSTAPSITEMLYALGLGQRVVGVTTFCHYPPEVREKPKIGTYLRPNFETILSLEPDLVVALKEHSELVKKLNGFELPVLALQHNDLEGIYASLLTLGERAGKQEKAAAEVARLRDNLARIRERSRGLPRRSVLFVVGRSRGAVRDLVVVGGDSYLNKLIAIAGGENAFADSPAHYPQIGREQLYARQFAVIIDMGDMSDTDNVPAGHRAAVRKLWEEFPRLNAVREGRVYAVAEDLFVVPGPRVDQTAELLFEMIHPEAAR